MSDRKQRRRGAGEATVYKRVRNGRVYWTAQVDVGRDANGKRRRKAVVGKTHAEVLEKLEKLRSDKKAGRVAKPGQLTVADLTEKFLAARGRSVQATTLATYKGVLKTHVAPHIGGLRLRHLAPVQVEDWLADLATANIGKRSQQLAFDVLRRCFDYGVSIDVLARNPMERLARPRAPRPEVRAPSAAEVRSLLTKARETSPPWVTAAVALGACGLRRQEVLGLRWADVDLVAAVVHVRQALQAPNGAHSTIGPVKTKESRRSVPLTTWAREAVEAHRAALKATPLPHLLVFSTKRGQPLHPSNFSRRHFKPLVARAGLPSLTFHQLRHGAASMLLGAGADLKSAQRILGHSRAATTLDTYADYIPENLGTAMAGLDALVANAKDTESHSS